jgi:hypothetical protein
MFNITYIKELLEGKLSENGYKHFLNIISYYIKKYNWPKYIIVSDVLNTSTYWSQDEIRELSHQYFECIISKGKLDYLNKIEESYISYYFTQILISFIANRIKENQQKKGLSYEKCKELTLEITNEDYIIKNIDGIDYAYNQTINKQDIKLELEINQASSYLSKIPLTEKTKHYKPLVKIVIEDVFNSIESPISVKKLIVLVYKLFDQKSFEANNYYSDDDNIGFEFSDGEKYKAFVKTIIHGLSKSEGKFISEYLFQSEGKASLSELAIKYDLPKSTIHLKIENFKKRIVNSYIPENETDGILFIQNIANALDEL